MAESRGSFRGAMESYEKTRVYNEDERRELLSVTVPGRENH